MGSGLMDRLDDIHARFRQRRHTCPREVGIVDHDSEVLQAKWIVPANRGGRVARGSAESGSRRQQPRSGQPPCRDCFAYVEHDRKMRARIEYGRHAGREHLPEQVRQLVLDIGSQSRFIGQTLGNRHRMHMGIDESGQHRHATGIDQLVDILTTRNCGVQTCGAWHRSLRHLRFSAVRHRNDDPVRDGNTAIGDGFPVADHDARIGDQEILGNTLICGQAEVRGHPKQHNFPSSSHSPSYPVADLCPDKLSATPDLPAPDAVLVAVA